MKFTPKSEKEIQDENLFPAGVYPFEVVKAEDETSKSGNEMIHLKLRVFSGARTQFVDDYLLESMAYKLRHAAVTLGLESEYESGRIAASDFEGKEGYLKLIIKKDKKGEYPDKNAVGDYVEEPKSSGPATPKAGTGGEDDASDDIPFAANVL